MSLILPDRFQNLGEFGRLGECVARAGSNLPKVNGSGPCHALCVYLNPDATVVLSAENEVFFQASLVTSASLATQFTLPSGQYTIGVFRIGLIEPEEVEPTVFQLKGTIVDSGQ